MSPESRQSFVGALLALAEAHRSLSDLFFQNRLRQEMDGMAGAYARYAAMPAKYAKDYVAALKTTSILLEELLHVGQGERIPNSVALEWVLTCLRDMLRLKPPKEKVMEDRPPVVRETVPVRQVEPKLKGVKASVAARRKKLIVIEEEILGFVKDAPTRRTREILDQFSALSDRTVQRRLRNLTESGLLVRTADKNIIYYSAR